MTVAICVFCGSAQGNDPAFGAAARAVGRDIARRGWTLVYGGGRVGSMGALADAALEAGGRVIGVIPRFLYEWEVGHDGLTEIEIVETLTERKVLMGDLGDAFLTLPGGIGTMDEMFEALSWAQLGLEAKCNGLLNVNGYYDQLVAYLDHAVASGFLKPQHRALLHVSGDPVELLDALGK
ncbi:MAG TPA: TIGR00730 family Rossman fold protein [Steroidobacteraceae bacterium]|nr:TIGR00730 family Rossman fold protein [Steroidobacteraceae bacterium]